MCLINPPSHLVLLELTLNAVVVEVQVLQVSIEEGNRRELIVGQLQVQQRGEVEHSCRNTFITQLVVVQPDERQVIEAFEVVPEHGTEKRFTLLQPR